MARFEFRLPDIGEGVTEGEIVAWHIKEGDRVAEDQLMVEVMTDKATVTIGAPRGGKIDRLLSGVGTIVKVGDVLVVIQTGNGSRPPVPGQTAPGQSAPGQSAPPPNVPEQAAASEGVAASAVGDIRDSLPGTAIFSERPPAAGLALEVADQHLHEMAASVVARPPGQTAAQAFGNGGGHFSEKPLAAPATRKLARDLKVDLRLVPGSGPHGRVTKQDVRQYQGSEAPMPASAGATLRPGGVAPGTPPSGRGLRSVRPGARVPFVGLRRRIAENMSQSKNTAAHFGFVEECDADRLIELRDRLRPEAKALGVELSYLPFVVKAVVAALKKNPWLNCTLDTQSNELVLHDRYHIGIAAATEQGLVVPVIHDADRRSLIGLAQEIERLASAARDGKLSRQELSGSTFTVTSLGKLAGLFAIPIINLPNVGILGIHRIKERPVVRDGQIQIGHVMLLSLSCDHRIVDGHVGAAFAYDVIHYLEDPARLMLES
jgi:pyruvate dehydrogenase E2 component (dihydrolipoamide acetyltransferase)